MTNASKAGKSNGCSLLLLTMLLVGAIGAMGYNGDDGIVYAGDSGQLREMVTNLEGLMTAIKEGKQLSVVVHGQNCTSSDDVPQRTVLINITRALIVPETPLEASQAAPYVILQAGEFIQRPGNEQPEIVFSSTKATVYTDGTVTYKRDHFKPDLFTEPETLEIECSLATSPGDSDAGIFIYAF